MITECTVFSREMNRCDLFDTRKRKRIRALDKEHDRSAIIVTHLTVISPSAEGHILQLKCEESHYKDH